MRIISAGMDRSGSTWQFNAIRILCAHANSEKTIISHWADSKVAHDADIEIIKAHRRGQVGIIIDRDVIFTSYRDVRAVVGSLIRIKWITADAGTILDYVEDYIRRLEGWQEIAAATMRYEDMIEHPDKELASISKVLNLKLSDSTLQIVLEDIQDLAVPELKMDQVTQLHVGHIGDVLNDEAIMRVPKDVEAAIVEKYGNWLRARGYTF